MEIIYAGQPFPQTLTSSVFLAGPTPRGETTKSWRPDMIDALASAGFDGTVFVPEPEHGKFSDNYLGQIEWEICALRAVDRILVWLPRDLEAMPAFTTNSEFGEFLESGRILYGRPEGAPKTRYQDLRWVTTWSRNPFTSLQELAEAAVSDIGDGAARSLGECKIPLDVWKTSQFQYWYAAQLEAGNRLDDARIEWTYRVGPNKDFLFMIALWVKVWITNERRHKANEFILSRPDISVIVPFYQHPDAEDRLYSLMMDTKVVCINEFRSPCRQGFVHELPGGSSWKPEDPKKTASDELREETSLSVDPDRFLDLGARQLAATTLTHRAHLFAVRLTRDEIRKMEKLESSGQTLGDGQGEERTYIEVKTIGDILEEKRMDYSMMGMILEAVCQL